MPNSTDNGPKKPALIRPPKRTLASQAAFCNFFSSKFSSIYFRRRLRKSTGYRGQPHMEKQWISDLADDIRQKGHEAAEDYGRAQHRAEIITTQGRTFFLVFAASLEENVKEVKRELQGDVTASDTTFQTTNHTEVKLTRARFPWFDARIVLQYPAILLDYAKGPGVAGDPSQDRKTCVFTFQVNGNDDLFIEESFGENPKEFRRPEELAQRITQLLFHI